MWLVLLTVYRVQYKRRVDGIVDCHRVQYRADVVGIVDCQRVQYKWVWLVLLTDSESSIKGCGWYS